MSQPKGFEVEIKGLALSKDYYENVGKPVLWERFPEYMEKAAVGLVGEGSECFGFDDLISTDHDYGPSFCVWLPREVYTQVGAEMMKVYDTFPKIYKGVRHKLMRVEAGGRRGILSVEDFYRKFLGRENVPENLLDWLRIPEHYLAVVTNGEVFEDNLGMFTQMREKLLSYYPEDVRLKKIAACAARMAHSGQCNYARMMWRNDAVAAQFALEEFKKNTIAMVYLLNKVYCPYYKWMWRGMENLPKRGLIQTLLDNMTRTVLDDKKWTFERWERCEYTLNRDDKMVDTVERISALIIEELQNQGISNSTSDYLEEHAYVVMRHIQDKTIQSLPLLIG